jgi:hypothetical protein
MRRREPVKHHRVDGKTDIQVDDWVICYGDWRQIWHISEDNGILVQGSWVCRTQLEAAVLHLDYQI